MIWVCSFQGFFSIMKNHFVFYFYMRIRVLSFDFHGCLYIERQQFRMFSVVEENKQFLDTIKNQQQQFGKTITLIGSSSQAYDDRAGFDDTALCFTEMPRLSEYINSEFDTFLLSDIYNNLNDGDSYKMAIQKIRGEQPGCLEGLSGLFSGFFYHTKRTEDYYDVTKIEMLYAQMHKIAHQYADDEIQFYFYNGDKDVLNHLKSCFDENNRLPRHVTLYLCQYNGREVQNYASISGCADLDKDYRETIKNKKDNEVSLQMKKNN